MSAPNDSDGTLDALLKKPYDKYTQSLLPGELACLVCAFLPSKERPLRAKAFLALSALCQGIRNGTSPDKNQADTATEDLARLFSPLVVSRFAEPSETDQLVAISFLTALFQVDRDSASSILAQDGFIHFVKDSLDLATNSQQLPLEVAHLLGQASGDKLCRPIVSSHCLDWLQMKSHQTRDKALRAASAIALVKLLKGGLADRNRVEPSSIQTIVPDGELASIMKGVIIEQNDQSSLIDAVEGLAYLSMEPVIKEVLATDKLFLTKLFSHARNPQSTSSFGEGVDSALMFGIVTVVTNLCGYPRHLTTEEAQMEKLKHIAQAGKGPLNDLHRSELEDNQHVRERGRRLIAAGVLGMLSGVVRLTESKGTRLGVGKAFLSLVEDKENRGKVLQSGGAKALTHIIKHSLSNVTPDSVGAASLDVGELHAIQALAKVAITSSPLQVFGPSSGSAYDAIRPFSILLLHPLASLLQRFEALMALTNLSSQSGCAERIAKIDALINNVELFLLEDHVMVRRAAMELICNLVAGSEEMFERWSKESKLTILLALSDIEDLPTQLAASGALAIATSSPTACVALAKIQRERGRVITVITQLIDSGAESDVGFAHRGVICARNFILSVRDGAPRTVLAEDAAKAGLPQALSKLVERQTIDATVANSATETLEFLRAERAP